MVDGLECGCSKRLCCRLASIVVGWGYVVADTADRNPAYVPGRDSSARPYLSGYHYGITADFVREYMSFGENSFVYIMSCSSDHPEMRSAFLDKGADAYAGWSQPVAVGGAYKAAMFLFDRLLGTNEVAPVENPRQRPFDLNAVYANLKERGLHKVGEAELNLWTRPGESLVLMPSVAYLEVREDSDELFLYGLFGSEEGEVTIKCVSTPVTHWAQDVIAVQLPVEGSGSAGDVIVKVLGHESNTVPLTEWRGEMRYVFVSQLPAPDLRTEVVIQAHFRADVHPYRKEPGKPPEERQDVHFVLADDSTAEWQMTGRSTQGGATFDLEGGGVLLLEKEQPDHGSGHFGLIGTLNTKGILLGNPPQITGLDFHIHRSDDPTEGTLTMTYQGGSKESGYPIPQTDALYDVTLSLEHDWSIKAGQRQSQTIRGHSVSMMGTGTLEWDQIQAKFAPDLTNLPHADVPLFAVLAAVR